MVTSLKTRRNAETDASSKSAVADEGEKLRYRLLHLHEYFHIQGFRLA